MTTKDDLHTLIERLPKRRLRKAQQFLERLKAGDYDPVVLNMLLAPWDDEPETEEERLAVKEAEEDLRLGRTVSMEEIKQEFGL